MRAIRTPAHRRRRPRRLASLLAVAGVAVIGPAATGSHTVRPGETLSEIAADHGVTVARLAEANGLADIHRVLAGQTLAMPDPSAGGGVVTHTVDPGETLSEIASRYGTTVRALAEANGIADVHHVRAGQRLAVSGGTSAGGGGRSGSIEVSRFPARLQSAPERLALVPRFEHWAAAHGAPVDLLMAMTWLESGWQHDVVSSAGAVGIGQLMPDTVTWMRDVVLRQPLDPYDADDNINMSARYLKWLLDRTGGDESTALAGYYQGLGAVQRSGVFPSTQVYVDDVLAFRDRHF